MHVTAVSHLRENLELITKNLNFSVKNVGCWELKLQLYIIHGFFRNQVLLPYSMFFAKNLNFFKLSHFFPFANEKSNLLHIRLQKNNNNAKKSSFTVRF
jgi:hypothetical protein